MALPRADDPVTTDDFIRQAALDQDSRVRWTAVAERQRHIIADATILLKKAEDELKALEDVRNMDTESKRERIRKKRRTNAENAEKGRAAMTEALEVLERAISEPPPPPERRVVVINGKRVAPMY